MESKKGGRITMLERFGELFEGLLEAAARRYKPLLIGGAALCVALVTVFWIYAVSDGLEDAADEVEIAEGAEGEEDEESENGVNVSTPGAVEVVPVTPTVVPAVPIAPMAAPVGTTVADFGEFMTALADPAFTEITISGGQPIPITGPGSVTIDRPVTILVAGNHRHFQVHSGGELIINHPMAWIQGRNLNQGYVVRDTNQMGGGIEVSGGTFILESGEIFHNNQLPQSGHSTVSGGGVSVSNGGTFTMKDGQVRNNQASSGGGVRVDGANSRFIFIGGEVSSNNRYHDGKFPEVALDNGGDGVDRPFSIGAGGHGG